MSKQSNKKKSGRSQGNERKHEKSKEKKKSQIRWSPWQMLRPSGTAAALRVAFVDWVKKTQP